MALALLILGGLAYGVVPSLNRLTAEGGIPYMAYVFWQSLGAGLILLTIGALRGRPPRLRWRHLRYYLVLGNVGFSIPYCLMVFLATHIPVGVMSLTLALVPILVYATALTLGMERFRLVRVSGIVLGLLGMLCILLPETSLPETGMTAWAALALIPPFLFTAGLIAGERLYPADADSLALAAGTLLAAAALVLPVMLATGNAWFFEAPFDEADAGVVAALFAIALTWFCFVEVIRLAGAVYYSTIAYLESLAGIGFGILIFAERHSLWVWAAAALIMAGLFLVNRMGRRPVTATA
jgi:drug/metabolite transporter (DMT)-like permease